MPSIRTIAIGLTIAAAIVGVKFWQSHLISQGDAQGAARVQAAWDAQENARNAATARDNATRFRNLERTAHEDAKREAARRVAIITNGPLALYVVREVLGRYNAAVPALMRVELPPAPLPFGEGEPCG